MITPLSLLLYSRGIRGTKQNKFRGCVGAVGFCVIVVFPNFVTGHYTHVHGDTHTHTLPHGKHGI